MAPANTLANNKDKDKDKGNGMRNLRDMISPGNDQTSETHPSTPVKPTQTTNKRAPPRLSIAEIIALKNEVTDAKTGKKYLECIALSIAGKPYKNKNEITELLLHTTQMAGVSLPAQTVMRVIAFILEEEAINEMTETIARHVTAAISPHIAKLQETEEKLTKTTTDLNASTTTQNTQFEEMKSTLAKLSTQVSETVTAKPTYAEIAAARNHTDPEVQTQHLQRIAREAIKERQLLIDFPSSSELAAGKSSHAQLVEKVKKALATLPKNNDTPELETRSIIQFRQGGIIIEMTTKEAAEHIRTKNNVKECLLQNLDPQATLKERTYTVVVPFMPTSFKPTDNTDLQQMEQENGWNKGTTLQLPTTQFVMVSQ
ncbi:hypothetical protein C8R48DRAFT_675628 [Suillus tomentosus]|nr:hypothetical protein C8R48DRAFT_675628 [Suillus tomentosus]